MSGYPTGVFRSAGRGWITQPGAAGPWSHRGGFFFFDRSREFRDVDMPWWMHRTQNPAAREDGSAGGSRWIPAGEISRGSKLLAAKAGQTKAGGVNRCGRAGRLTGDPLGVACFSACVRTGEAQRPGFVLRWGSSKPQPLFGRSRMESVGEPHRFRPPPHPLPAFLGQNARSQVFTGKAGQPRNLLPRRGDIGKPRAVARPVGGAPAPRHRRRQIFVIFRLPFLFWIASRKHSPLLKSAFERRGKRRGKFVVKGGRLATAEVLADFGPEKRSSCEASSSQCGRGGPSEN